MAGKPVSNNSNNGNIGKRKKYDKIQRSQDKVGVMVICPRCGYTWYTWSTKPYLRCNGCGAQLRNPIHEVLEDLEKHRNTSLGAEIYKLIMNEPLISPAELIRKGLVTKAIYYTLRKMEREGKIKLVRIGNKIFIPLSELPKLVRTSDIYMKQQEKEKKKQEETVQGPGVQLPAP